MGQVTFDVRLGDIAQPAFTLEEIFLFLEQAERPCVVVIDEAALPRRRERHCPSGHSSCIQCHEGRAYRIADPLLELWLSRELG